DQRARDDGAPGAGVHTPLAAVLVLGLARRLLDGDRLRVVDRPPARLLHPVREAEVVAELRVVLDVRLAPARVDRAVAGGDRAAGGLLLAHPDLVPPVETLQILAVGALEPELPAHVADLGIGEVADELTERIRLPLG